MHRTANTGARRSSVAAALAALMLAMTLGGCATSGAAGHVPVPKPFPMPGSGAAVPNEPAPLPPEAAAPPPIASPSTPSAAPAREKPSSAFDSYALVGTALDLRGTPYLDGGASPHGFDCSGFTQYVFAQFGVELPRAVREQYRVGQTIKPPELAAGDLLFFATTEPGASHVAISVGTDQFVHAPSSTGVVRVERLSSSYWSQRFIGARRVR